MNDKFVLACDEHGTPVWPNPKRTFTIGGFATKLSNRSKLVSVWQEIKDELCVDSSAELKWSHFFPGRHKGLNPLKTNKRIERRNQALWALHKLFNEAYLFPITTIVRKDKASSLYKNDKTPKGNNAIDIGNLLAVLLGQFALYLKEFSGQTGEIWFDHLGTRKEEKKLRTEFMNTFGDLSKLPKQNRVHVEKIDLNVKFFDSKIEPFVQLADFVSGVMWAASEGEEWFFLHSMEKYLRGKSRTYGIAILEN